MGAVYDVYLIFNSYRYYEILNELLGNVM